MKTKLLLIVAFFLMSGIGLLHAQQIINSTSNGGLWTDPSTWIEAVPSNVDSVILHGPVSMLSYTGWCKSLNITSVASIGGNGGQGSLNVYGSMYNNGNIVGSINYYLHGNLVNNQPWIGVDNHIQFTGMNHTINCAPGASINAQLEAVDSSQNFTLLSDVTFNTTHASDFGFSQFDAGIHKLTVTGGQFNNCRVHSLDTLQFDTNVSSLELTGDYKLKGNIICYLNMSFCDKATNYGSIQFLSGVGADPLKLKGDFINEGTMNHIWVQVEKNIVNHGTWSCYKTEFKGIGDKHISQSAGHPFGGGEQFLSDNSGSKIYLDSDVEFTVPEFYLNNNTLDCGNHTLTANTSFFDGTIQSEAEIKGNNDFWRTTFTGNVIFSGSNRFSNSIMNGTVENTGMLKEITFYGGNFTSNNHLINSNSIQSLQLKIYGNLTNYGTIDNNSTVDVLGVVTQYINFTNSINSPVRFFSNVTGASYQWMKDGEDISNQVSNILYFSTLQLSDAGIYQCRVITTGGETIFSREIVVNNVTSVTDIDLLTSLIVTPNPFVDHITLQWEQKIPRTIEIDLLDVNGRLVKEIEKSVFSVGCHKKEVEMDNSIKQGVYIIRIIADNKPAFIKIIRTK